MVKGMLADLPALLAGKTDDAFRSLLAKRKAQALFHVPLLGGFMVLFFSILLVKNRASLPETVKKGIAVQILVPLLFALGSLLRWALWFFWFEVLSDLLFYALAAYLVGCYLLMLYGALGIWRAGTFSYPVLEPVLEKIGGWFSE